MHFHVKKREREGVSQKDEDRNTEKKEGQMRIILQELNFSKAGATLLGCILRNLPAVISLTEHPGIDNPQVCLPPLTYFE